TLERYKTSVEHGKYAANTKQALQKALREYTDALNTYLAVPSPGDEKTQAYESLRGFAHEMEQTIEQSFIPDATTLMLQIRRNEKDYLLRRERKYVDATHSSLEGLKQRIKSSGIALTYAEALLGLLDTYQQAFDALVALDDEVVQLTASMREAIHK